MRSTSDGVTVRGAITTITSPSGRNSTPRATHAAVHAPAPAEALDGRCELDADHETVLADVAHGVTAARVHGP